MPRKRNLLNVKSHLEHLAATIDAMLERDGKYENGLRFAPIDRDNLAQIRIINRAILRKHAERKTRKDLYIEA